MHCILRRDGEFTIYRVECYVKGVYPHWTDASDNAMFHKNVPMDRRMVKTFREDGTFHYYTGEHQEPFKTFCASGECWQETGIFGSYDREPAQDLLHLLAIYNPGYQFRLVEHKVSQIRTVLAEAREPKVAS